MATKWQRFKVAIPEEYKPGERQAIAEDIIDFIRDRVTGKNLDKNNRPLPGYSASYVKSLDFKVAGKSKNDVNLTLSGDMLGALQLLSHKRGELTIGFENGSPENAKADGNIRGTYGKPKPVGPRRDFLGLTQRDLGRILKGYPVADSITRGRNADIAEAARKIAGSRSVKARDVEEEGDDE